MDYRLDGVDRRILYHLVADARNTTAPLIAEEVDVSPGTIRNRIDKLEAVGVLSGYHAEVDYERAEGLLTNLYVCAAPAADRERIAREALSVPGVVHVRETATGTGNVHVKAVDTDTDDLTRIARALSDLGLEIRTEELILDEHFAPYAPYGPDETGAETTARDFMSLAGDAEIVEVRVTADAPVTGMTVDEAASEGLLGEGVLVVAVERNGELVAPKGDTRIHEGDVANLLFRAGHDEDVIRAFGGEVVRP